MEALAPADGSLRAGADPMRPRPYRVVHNRRETRGVVTLTLEPLEAPKSQRQPASYEPGQFNMLWAFGVGEAAISISGDRPGGGVLHTIRDVGAISGALCRARRGTVVGLRGPFGTGWDVEDAEGADVVVVAGGLGLAPLRPVVRHILAARRRFGRVAILLGARSPDQLLYRREAARWERAGLVAATVDHAFPGWTGPVGLVTDLIDRAAFDPSQAFGFVCGPEVMMRFSARALAERGVPQGRIRLSIERNMKCAVGLCGHCQLGPAFVCRDGPVFTWECLRPLVAIREL